MFPLQLNLSFKLHLFIGLIVAIWLVLFLVLIAPFDASDLSFRIRLLLLPPYGLISFLGYLVIILIQRWVSLKWKRWTIFSEIGIILIFNILVLLGSYKTILDAVHERNFLMVGTVTVGAIFGLLSFARLLKWMFKNYRNATLALLTGFIFGSLSKIWPWKKVLETKVFDDKIIPIKELNVSPFSFEGEPQLLPAIGLAIAGFSLIFILERLAAKK